MNQESIEELTSRIKKSPPEQIAEEIVALKARSYMYELRIQKLENNSGDKNE